MLRNRFGKLAIAVLAVSGVAAHAGVSDMLNSLKPSSVGGEAMVLPFVHTNKALLPNSFATPWTQAKLGSVDMDWASFATVGPFKLNVRLGAERFHGAGLHNSSAESVKAAATVSSAEEVVADAPKARASNQVQGWIGNVGAKATYNWGLLSPNYSALSASIGVVFPENATYKESYFAGIIRTVFVGYQASPSVVFELGGKTIVPFDKSVNAVSGVTVGARWII